VSARVVVAVAWFTFMFDEARWRVAYIVEYSRR
jgi:hypothetical protein